MEGRVVLMLLIVWLSGLGASVAKKHDRHEKRRLHVIHRNGKSIEDLVSMGKFYDPHDLNGLVESVKPKLIEESHQERMMLQQNGIEDMYPLDATVEYGHRKRLPKPIEATEIRAEHTTRNYAEPDNEGQYNLKDMPEYNVETKADYKGNEEAAEWLMNNPNRFNVMPEEDSKGLYEDVDPTKEGEADDATIDKEASKEKYQDENESNESFSKGGQYMDDYPKNDPDDSAAIYSKYQKFADSLDTSDGIENMNTYKAESRHHSLDTSEGNENMNSELENEAESRHNSELEEKVSNDVPSEKEGKNEDNVDNYAGVAHGNSDAGNDVNEENNGRGNEEKEERKEVSDMLKASKAIEQMMKSFHMRKDDDEHRAEESKHRAEEDAKDEEHKAEDGEHIANDGAREEEDGARGKQSPMDVMNGFLDKARESPKLVPVYRMTHKQRMSHLRRKSPINRVGTVRHQVHLVSKTPRVEEPQAQAPPGMLKGIKEEMIHRTSSEATGGTGSPLSETPSDGMRSESAEAAQKHDISGRFGAWNGWTTCSVSCGRGSMMRARLCRTLPCKSSDLYQTKPCVLEICPSEWIRESLDAHNNLRSRHHSPPLSWSPVLAAKAKKLARELATRDYIGSQDLHEGRGENIAQVRDVPNSFRLAEKAVNQWYKESRAYSFSYPELSSKDRHFVQMVWQKTKTVGMASARSPNGEYSFVVALYGGPGINGRTLRANVLRAGRSHDVYTTFRDAIPRHERVDNYKQ